MCFGIFVIVGFWSHLKIAVCFACLVAKKMQEVKQKNIDFYNFLGNEVFVEEHEPFWESEEEHEEFWGSGEEHKEHNKGMIFQQNNKKKKIMMKRMGETFRFGLVFLVLLFKKLLDLNSCEFWFLILFLFFYLVKINKLIF